MTMKTRRINNANVALWAYRMTMLVNNNGHVANK